MAWPAHRICMPYSYPCSRLPSLMMMLSLLRSNSVNLLLPGQKSRWLIGDIIAGAECVRPGKTSSALAVGRGREGEMEYSTLIFAPVTGRLARRS